MYHCLFVEPETKVIHFPRTKEDLDEAWNETGGVFTLPGCIGAIDGSLIPCKKPTKAQADGDTDAYYGYKGYMSTMDIFPSSSWSCQCPCGCGTVVKRYIMPTLLLAVVDTFGRSIYVLAGAPRCCGDTGLFGNCSLKDLTNEGILTQSSTQITIGDNVHEISI